MGIPEYVARTRSGSPAVARWSLAERSKSQCSHRARAGWAEGQASGLPQRIREPGFPQVRRNTLLLGRADARQSGRPEHSRRGTCPGTSNASHRASPQAPARRRRGPAAARIREFRMATAERREARPPPPTSSRPADPESRRQARGGDARPATQECEPTWTPWLIPEDAAAGTRPKERKRYAAQPRTGPQRRADDN